eukprot:766915-Hanusia_phi.AAC.1
MEGGEGGEEGKGWDGRGEELESRVEAWSNSKTRDKCMFIVSFASEQVPGAMTVVTSLLLSCLGSTLIASTQALTSPAPRRFPDLSQGFIRQHPSLALRGGSDGRQDQTQRVAGVKTRDEESSTEPLPPMLESVIRVVETWWMVALVWLINLELFWRGGLLRVLELLLLGGRSPQVGIAAADGQLGKQQSSAGEGQRLVVRLLTS